MRSLLATALVAAGLFATSAAAVTVTATYTGTLKSDPNHSGVFIPPALTGLFSLSDTISATFTYDTDLADINLNPDNGAYPHGHFSFTIGGFSATGTTTINVNDGTNVPGALDGFGYASAAGNVDTQSGISGFFLSAFNLGGSSLGLNNPDVTSQNLPTTPFDLSVFPNAQFIVTFRDNTTNAPANLFFKPDAPPTPDTATTALLLAGSLAGLALLRRRRAIAV